MELSIFDINGKDTGKKIALNAAIYGIEPNEHVLWLDIKQYLANQRQGTHKTKERNEVAGSTKKIIRQKGSGGARRGDIKSPVLVGGGRAHGPRPRDYSFKLNKKVKVLARKSALATKAKNNEIIILEDLSLAAPKTKDMVALAKNLQVADKKVLLVLPDQNKNVYLSARNIQRFDVVRASDLNTYAILNANRVIIAESSVAVIDNILKA